jgi:heptosyltransferase-1
MHDPPIQVLLVKTSSLGDVVHNLPVVSDIRRHLGDVAIDWVVERSFAAIPAMHPGVRKVIPSELRRWRRSWLAVATRAQWRSFLRELRSRSYETIIDTQGLLKSAVLARLAHGERRIGLDWQSSREPLGPFYHRTFRVSWDLHAVERNRRLAGLALGYEPEGPPDYGLQVRRSSASWLPRGPYAVLLHATSHSRKLWPESCWVQLGQQLSQAGLDSILPWGSAEEEQRARVLAQSLPGACVAPRLELDEMASILAGARAVIGVDTGLTHLAAALQVPVVGLYGATDPRATGVYAQGSAANLGAPGAFPPVRDVMEALGGLGAARSEDRCALQA